jgi:hypothetical protein
MTENRCAMFAGELDVGVASRFARMGITSGSARARQRVGVGSLISSVVGTAGTNVGFSKKSVSRLGDDFTQRNGKGTMSLVVTEDVVVVVVARREEMICARHKDAHKCTK